MWNTTNGLSSSTFPTLSSRWSSPSLRRRLSSATLSTTTPRTRSTSSTPTRRIWSTGSTRCANTHKPLLYKTKVYRIDFLSKRCLTSHTPHTSITSEHIMNTAIWINTRLRLQSLYKWPIACITVDNCSHMAAHCHWLGPCLGTGPGPSSALRTSNIHTHDHSCYLLIDQ